VARIFTGQTRRTRAAGTWAACLILGLGLAGCSVAADTPAAQTPAAQTPADQTPASESAATPPASTQDAAPVLAPDAAAADNQAYFDSVVAATLATEANPAGRTIIDALTAAGFDKAAMQVTADTTTEGKPVDSIQFSVRFNDECIVGQNGPSSGGYHSAITPLLGSGTCLVGATPQIDW
jgi:hypothetical protein